MCTAEILFKDFVALAPHSCHGSHAQSSAQRGGFPPFHKHQTGREFVVTGIVSGLFKDGSMEINMGNERRPNLRIISFHGLKPPKEVEKVRVHGYYHGDPDDLEMIATKIEKIGEADGGSKKR